MSYDFTVRTPGNTPAARAEASGRSSSPTPLGVERTVLYGTDIRRCSVPQETLFHGDYQVGFRNPQGQGFGLNYSQNTCYCWAESAAEKPMYSISSLSLFRNE